MSKALEKVLAKGKFCQNNVFGESLDSSFQGLSVENVEKMQNMKAQKKKLKYRPKKVQSQHVRKKRVIRNAMLIYVEDHRKQRQT